MRDSLFVRVEIYWFDYDSHNKFEKILVNLDSQRVRRMSKDKHVSEDEQSHSLSYHKIHEDAPTEQMEQSYR